MPLLCAAPARPDCGRYPPKHSSQLHPGCPLPRSSGRARDHAVASGAKEGLWPCPEAGPGSGSRPPPPPVLSKRPALLIFVGGLGWFPSPPVIPSVACQIPVLPRPPQTLSPTSHLPIARPPISSISRAKSLHPLRRFVTRQATLAGEGPLGRLTLLRLSQASKSIAPQSMPPARPCAPPLPAPAKRRACR